ncbi:MAG: peptidoglycan-binding domain-containing protein [Paracoccus sp. (in: a-proteobacteria)]|nr:peptidoglycan-binding domain-containing protein [Paracoccus sp. (in: a-proteobacteria)]
MKITSLTRISALALGAAMIGPMPGFAEDVFIRIEARRDAGAAATGAAELARDVGTDAGAVVSYPLPGGQWHAIAIGPLPRDEAQETLGRLRSAGQIPADAFLSPAEGVSAIPAGETVDAPLADGEPSEAPAEPEAAPEAAPEPEAPPPEDHVIRLAAHEDRAAAERDLAELRADFPDASLWAEGEDSFVITTGPMTEAAATAWLRALAASEAAEPDGTLPEADLGDLLDAGEPGDWPAPPETPAPMPPLEDVQRALQWAGFYEGEIDGLDGPQTQAAIAAEIATWRDSTDPGTAMIALEDRREAWRGEMGLTTLTDDHTGLSITAPTGRITHERTERGLSVYGPKDGSGAALILFAQPGGQQEMLDMTGLITALGWVPAPSRQVSRGAVRLAGEDGRHIGQARARVQGDMVEGWVLIWPASDPLNATRIAAEMADTLERVAPTRAEREEAEAEAAEASEPAEADAAEAGEAETSQAGESEAAADDAGDLAEPDSDETAADQ